MTPDRRSARFRARHQVQAAIADCQRQETTRLPTTAELARRAQVSPVTMLRVLRGFRDDGVLWLRQRSGIRLVGPEARSPRDPAQTPPKRLPRWKQIRDMLSSDISNVRFGTDRALPGIAELRARFGAGYQAVHRALESLRARGMIERHGRGYRAAGPVRHASYNRLVMITGSGPDGAHLASDARARDLLREFESACGRYRLALDIGGWNGPLGRFTSGGISLPQLRSAKRRAWLGVIVVCQAMEQWRETTRLFLDLCAFDGPVVFIDETGQCTNLPLPWSSSHLFRIAFGWSPLAGRDVGTYLAALGHRRIAYLAPLHGTLWSRNRLWGLRQSFPYPGAVLPCVNERLTSTQTVAGASARLRRSVNATMRAAQQQSESVHELGPAVLEHMRLQYYPAFNAVLTRSVTRPLIEQALADETVTALVAANDTVAAEVRRYTSSLRRRCSLIGFDDSITAVNERITSYNFNIRAVVEHALRIVLRPSDAPRARELEPAGFITDRGSVHSLKTSGSHGH